jgi:hypothetical protein
MEGFVLQSELDWKVLDGMNREKSWAELAMAPTGMML